MDTIRGRRPPVIYAALAVFAWLGIKIRRRFGNQNQPVELAVQAKYTYYMLYLSKEQRFYAISLYIDAHTKWSISHISIRCKLRMFTVYE